MAPAERELRQERGPSGHEPGAGNGWLSTQEAAQYLGVSRFTIARLARGGHLPVYVSPFDKRKKFYHRGDLDRLRNQPVVAAS